MLGQLRNRIARSQDQGGFTLIELLVVIVIIGILLAVAVPSYLNFKTRAENSASKANVRSSVPSAEAYYADNGTYVGMDTADLQLIDPAIKVTVLGASDADSYCLRSTTTPHWYKQGPSGNITDVACAGPA